MDAASTPVLHAGTSASFSALTTLRAGGPATRLLIARTRAEVLDTIGASDRADEPLLAVGGGSNLVVADAGFDGTAVKIATAGRHLTTYGRWVELVVEAGESWADLVDFCVEENLSGIECLAAIPGTCGAVPVQNVGAYGQEVSSTITSVEAFDRRRGRIVEFSAPMCGFAYRSSRFKGSNRWVILSVKLRLRRSRLSAPLRYAQVTDALDIGIGSSAPIPEVRDAVVQLRRSKGMVLDLADGDTRSVGSFFTNPILGPNDMEALRRQVRDRLGSGVAIQRFPAGNGYEKVSAAWLIEQAGYRRGFRLGAAGISSKHALALVLHGGHSAEPVLGLARLIRAAVNEKFGVTLEVEPTLVGARL